MRKSFLAVVGCIAVLGAASCNSSKHSSSKRLPGMWQVQPIVVDGDNKDWPSPYPDYDDKAMLGYAVSNDKDNLYITVETGDLATQLKILREGLTVWIDRTGNKEEQVAINYPIPMSAQEGYKPPPKDNNNPQHPGGSSADKLRMDMEDKVKAALAEAKEYSLQGFKSCNLQYPIMENDSCGIKVRMKIDADNELIWEAVVPFRTFYPKGQLTRADRGKPIAVGFETTGQKRPAGQPGGGNGGNRGGGGGGGFRPSVGFGGPMGMGMRMGGGGMRGGNRNAQQNSNNNIMEPLYKSTKTWKKQGLAYME